MEKEPVEITVTVPQLMMLAKCGCRMLGYAKPTDNLLLTVLESSKGVPVKIKLDQKSLIEKKFRYDTS